MAKVSVGAVQSLEGGLRETRIPILEKIAAVLDCTVDALLAEEAEARDPRLARLLPDDLEIADLYQRASGPLKVEIRAKLEAYHAEARAELAQREGGGGSTAASTFRDGRPARANSSS